MKVTKYLPILAVCLMTTGCNSKKEAVLTSGIDLANLDTTAVPGTSFYQYACGGWVKAHPLTDEYSRFGTFDMLRENSREQERNLRIHCRKSEERYTALLYDVCRCG